MTETTVVVRPRNRAVEPKLRWQVSYIVLESSKDLKLWFSSRQIVAVQSSLAIGTAYRQKYYICATTTLSTKYVTHTGLKKVKKSENLVDSFGTVRNAAQFWTCCSFPNLLYSKAFDYVNSKLANDNAFEDSVQVDLSFARFESSLSKAFD